LLEEDVCFCCGQETSNEHDWSSLIICDGCEGEYHLECVNLQQVPSQNFHCPRCLDEHATFRRLNFDVHKHFQLPLHNKDLKIRYSFSQPLELAWSFCLMKGFMMVANVFSCAAMKKLTHGVILRKTHSGRVVDIWNGASIEVGKRLSDTVFTNVVNREGRFDMTLPEFVISDLQLPSLLEPILTN